MTDVQTHPVAVEFIEGDLPPIVRSGKSRPHRLYAEEAEQIRSRPGVWAILRRDFSSQAAATQLARNIMAGQVAAFRQRPVEDPSSWFEARSRTVDDEYRVYVRFMRDAP